MMIIISIIIAYLLGSLSSAIIISKLAKLPDPRKGGSGNPGASNVLRLAGKHYALLTLVGDLLKGFVAVLIGMILGLHGFWLSIVAVAAIVGHMYPVFFGFKGGKGVATAIGSFFALSLPLGLAAAVIWIVLAVIFRYASLASLAACVLAPFIALAVQPVYFIGLAVIAALIVFRHWDNIDRLRNGTEDKLDLSAIKKGEIGGASESSAEPETEEPEEPSEPEKPSETKSEENK